jgi:hypothetical protein
MMNEIAGGQEGSLVSKTWRFAQSPSKHQVFDGDVIYYLKLPQNR